VIPGFEEFMIHQVEVETHAGEDPFGNVHTTLSDPIKGFMDEKRELVRGTSGDQVVSEATFYTGKEHEPLFLPETIVHYRGKASTVIGCKLADSGPLNLPDHIAVVLT
jgi:hypothetical protein